ncbi:MAG: AAA family ATPase [Betaproteobacteria bacterium]|nr:AAA family ATPase [Betaproteobacteria bacterium]
MYLEHFGLSEMPFTLTPATAFLFAGRAHQEAFNTLALALDAGEGFVKITGEVGTGKTILCRRFLDVLRRRNIPTAYIPNPALRPRTLLLALGEELGLRLPANKDEYRLMKAFNKALLGIAAQGKTAVVCLDEAQALPLPTLESLRLLSNLETERRKLLQVVMFGQPELDRRLALHSVRQLRQRIGFEYRLEGLSAREVDRYLAHRLTVAGHTGPDLFGPAAVRGLARVSGGVPRLVNILANKALLAVYGEGGREVLPRHVLAAARDCGETRRRAVLASWLGVAHAWLPRLSGHADHAAQRRAMT